MSIKSKEINSIIVVQVNPTEQWEWANYSMCNNTDESHKHNTEQKKTEE